MPKRGANVSLQSYDDIFYTDFLRKYFPKSYTAKQMEGTIIRRLEQYMKKRQRDMER